MAGRRKLIVPKVAVFLGALTLVFLCARGWLKQDPANPPRPATRVNSLASQTVTTGPVTTGPATTGPATTRAAEQRLAPPPPANPTPEQIAAAKKACERGLDLKAKNDLVTARQVLSEVLAAGMLSDAQAQECRTALMQIAQQVVFSDKVFPHDPYAYRYAVKANDSLTSIVRKETLLIPAEGIQLINGIKDAKRLQVGQWLKLIKGPFDAIVTKHNFTLDLYQHGMFVKSYRVGLGQNGSTPVGLWMVAPGGRIPRAPWTPPPSSTEDRVIKWGQPGYPLGKEGLWISLRGLDKTNEGIRGFGIHGTDQPDSVGKQASLGCVRLGDADIAELFSLLCEDNSRIEVRP